MSDEKRHQGHTCPPGHLAPIRNKQNVGVRHFGESGGDDFQFEQMCEVIWNDPFGGAERAAALHRRFRRRGYEQAVLGYVLAAALAGRPDLHKRFYGHPFFEGPHTPNVQFLLQHATQFIYGARDGSEGRRAAEHARVLQPAFNAGVKPAQVLAMLVDHGGFDGFGSAFVQWIAAAEVALPAPEVSVEEPGAEGHDDGEVFAGGAAPPGNVNPPVDESAPEPEKPPRLTVKQILEQYLLVDAGTLHHAHPAFAMEVWGVRPMQLQRLPDGPDGFAAFRVTFEE